MLSGLLSLLLSFLQGLGLLPSCPLLQLTGIPLVQDALGRGECIIAPGVMNVSPGKSHLSAWDIGAGTHLRLDFRTNSSLTYAAHPDSHYLVNYLGCLINSDCFNPGIFLLVKRMKIKYKSQIWVLWCVFGLCDSVYLRRSEQKQTLNCVTGIHFLQHWVLLQQHCAVTNMG